MWTARLTLLWTFALCAAYYDLRYRRVPNRLILAAAVAGGTLAAAGGWGSLRAGLEGMALGLALLLPFFLLGMVGGGDVKTLAVVGMAAGPGLLWVSFSCGAAAGGIAALWVLAAEHRRGRIAEGTGARAPARTIPYAGILALCAAAAALLR